MRSLIMPAAAVLLAASTLVAFAHTKLIDSTPAGGATVASGLSEISMRFSHPVRLMLLKVRHAADNARVPLKGALPRDFEDTVKVGIEALSAGDYDATWTAISKDGHVTKGHLSFKVAEPGPVGQ